MEWVLVIVMQSGHVETMRGFETLEACAIAEGKISDQIVSLVSHLGKRSPEASVPINAQTGCVQISG